MPFPQFLKDLGYPCNLKEEEIAAFGWSLVHGPNVPLVGHLAVGDCLKSQKVGMAVEEQSVFNEEDHPIRNKFSFEAFREHYGQIKVYRHKDSPAGKPAKQPRWMLVSMDAKVIAGDVATVGGLWSYETLDEIAEEKYHGSEVRERGYLSCSKGGYGNGNYTVANIMAKSGAAYIWRRGEMLKPKMRYRLNPNFSKELPLP